MGEADKERKVKRFADVDWMEFIARELDAGHLFQSYDRGKRAGAFLRAE